MSAPFTTRAQLNLYLRHDRIECLECGRRFAFLVNHLRVTHDITPEDYRQRWGMPAMTALAGLSYREAHRAKIIRMQRSAALNYAHLPQATQAAREADKSKKGIAVAEQARLTQRLRPGDAHRIAPGARRCDGRDADRARAYQQAYRALKSGDDKPMTQYRRKYGPSD